MHQYCVCSTLIILFFSFLVSGPQLARAIPGSALRDSLKCKRGPHGVLRIVPGLAVCEASYTLYCCGRLGPALKRFAGSFCRRWVRIFDKLRNRPHSAMSVALNPTLLNTPGMIFGWLVLGPHMVTPHL